MHVISGLKSGFVVGIVRPQANYRWPTVSDWETVGRVDVITKLKQYVVLKPFIPISGCQPHSEPRKLLPYSYEPKNGAYPEPSNPPSHHISLRSNLILSSNLRLDLPSCFFPSASPIKERMHFSSPPRVLYGRQPPSIDHPEIFSRLQIMKFVIM
jgi:hypothetical protein